MHPLVDLKRLAESGQPMAGQWPLQRFVRLMEGAPVLPDVADAPANAPQAPAGQVHWRVQAEWRHGPADLDHAGRPASPRLWLHLEAQALVPQECQRCLEPYAEPLELDRWFRFAPDETTAAAEDEDSEEDVLVWTPRLDLLELLEDELLLALPLVPMHARCPQQLPAATVGDPFAGDAGLSQDRVHPFAGLAALKNRRSP